MEEIFRAKIATPAGEMVAITSSEGVLALMSATRADLSAVTSRLCGGAKIVDGENGHMRQLKKELSEYFDKKRKVFDVKCVLKGTDFRVKAWEALRRIPYGTTISYSRQAEEVGVPNGCRAVGQANGKNIIEIIVPCHRVVAKDGALTGFAGGIDVKRKLIEHER